VRTIAIVNQKGGCGKTTTAINLAAIYARRGLRTLLVDMDPQSHCAAGLGVPENRIEFTIGQALLAEHAGFNPAGLVWEVSRNLHLAPSTMSLASLEAPGGGLHALTDKDRRLENLLNAIAPHYDRCLIDCSPTIGLLTFNALRAARETLIPVETGFFSLRGAAKQWNTIQRLIQHIGRPIACHMLATLHDPASRLATNILSALRREFAGQIIPVVIREHEVLREAASFGQPVLEYAPQSEACQDFEALADWLEEHHSRPGVQIEVLPEATLPLQVNGALDHAEAVAPTAAPVMAGASAFAPRPALQPITSVQSAPVVASAPVAVPPVPLGSRAAELARRVTDLRGKARTALESAAAAFEPLSGSAAITEAEAISLEIIPPIGAPESELQPAQNGSGGSASNAHLLGVRQTSRGTLFIQPLRDAGVICIAGDFNQWSPDAHPMRRNDDAGVFERIIDLPPGRYQYRLVIDGRWVADAHNPQQLCNTYGEPISIVEVAP
jgi:chromosome partitioning protein